MVSVTPLVLNSTLNHEYWINGGDVIYGEIKENNSFRFRF
nr:MAG TPA: hypothetical protein [Caudoviricetes sp.]